MRRPPTQAQKDLLSWLQHAGFQLEPGQLKEPSPPLAMTESQSSASGVFSARRCFGADGATSTSLTLVPSLPNSLRPVDPDFAPDADEPTAQYGSLGELSARVGKILAGSGIDATDSPLVTAFVKSTWVPDYLRSCICITISGLAGCDAALHDLLLLLVGRSLPLASASLAQVVRQPDASCSTLFLRDPRENDLRRLLAAANDYIFLGGRCMRLQCPIVVFSSRPLPSSLSTLAISLPEDSVPYRHLPDEVIGEVLLLRQQLRQYRIDQHQPIWDSGFDAAGFAPETRAIARILGCCEEGDVGLQQDIVEALAHRDQAERLRRAESPEAAVAEAILLFSHEGRSGARVGDVQAVANSILEARQNPARVTLPQCSEILRERIGLRSDRRGRLLLGPAVSPQIHRFALGFFVLSLFEPHPGCPSCAELAPRLPQLPSGNCDCEAPVADVALVHTNDFCPKLTFEGVVLPDSTHDDKFDGDK